MKKFIPIAIVGILVLSGLGAAAITTNTMTKQPYLAQKETAQLLFDAAPLISEHDGFINVAINGATTQLIQPNKPVLPITVKTYQIPYGSKNIQITCTPKTTETMTLSKQIMPARVAPVSKLTPQTAYITDDSVYASAALYPNSWYSTDLGAGRNDQGQEVIFVKVVCYPVRYSPTNNEITYTDSFDLSISYDTPTTQPKTIDAYDMVIIAPAAFQTKIQPLIDEKNAKGVATLFKSVEDILTEYTGYDQPEQIKYFIKYAYDTYGITYVLLFGGLKSHLTAHDKDTRSAGYTDWWVPVRYVSMPQDEDEACLSDLYYGCLYNATGGFDSWDSNHDGVYAAWDAPHAPNDKFDMYPEVYVSRLPVSSKLEVSLMVKKIIQYESTGPDAKPWFKNFVGVGGKTFDYFEGQPDGEYLTSLAYNYTKNAFPDLNLVKVYTTNRDIGGLVPNAKDITKAVSDGAGFVDFEGHGNPLVWDTIWFDGTYPYNWSGGINLLNFAKFTNRQKLPIVVVGGCHNGLYNISMIPSMKDKNGSNYFTYGYPTPVCFSWGFVLKYPGGAIGATGDTGFGMGYEGNPVTLSAELESNFFYKIGHGATNLAQAHSQAIQKFLSEENITQIEGFVITNWALFGDPSLKIGGYSS
jgi:hypothetical protein